MQFYVSKQALVGRCFATDIFGRTEGWFRLRERMELYGALSLTIIEGKQYRWLASTLFLFLVWVLK